MPSYGGCCGQCLMKCDTGYHLEVLQVVDPPPGGTNPSATTKWESESNGVVNENTIRALASTSKFLTGVGLIVTMASEAGRKVFTGGDMRVAQFATLVRNAGLDAAGIEGWEVFDNLKVKSCSWACGCCGGSPSARECFTFRQSSTCSSHSKVKIEPVFSCSCKNVFVDSFCAFAQIFRRRRPDAEKDSRLGCARIGPAAPRPCRDSATPRPGASRPHASCPCPRRDRSSRRSRG